MNGSIKKLSGIVKLWENPEPTSAFGAQTITLEDNQCDFFILEVMAGSTSGWWSLIQFVPVRPGWWSYIISPVGGQNLVEGSVAAMYRQVNNITQTSMTFGLAFANSVSGRTTENRSDLLIPMRVYGVYLTT